MPFITFEGVEGCGKSTQLQCLAERLRATGASPLVTREPGGTAVGREIRAILMDPPHAMLEPMAEWLLFEADRRQHVSEVVAPALSKGAFVLCDRFSDSTEAYQLAGRGLDPDLVRLVDRSVRGGLAPDLTLLYDIDPREGLARANRRDAGRSGRFENAALELHERVREAFLAIARREPERVAVIPVVGDSSAVFARTWEIVSTRFGL